MKGTIIFHECEHTGDLDTYIEDLRNSGATIVNSQVDAEEETGYVSVEVANDQDFITKFKATESFDFSSMAGSY